MITPGNAWDIVVAHTRVLPPVELSAGTAHGHYLARAVYADRDLPPASRSAMDGFALGASSIRDVPASLPVVAEIAAGAPAGAPIPAGACARIFTGANLPPGTDTVVMQEDTEPAGTDLAVRFLKAVVPGANVYRQGENARRGDVLLAPGTRLDAAALALCATVGQDRMAVHRRPTVVLLTTGSELLAAGETVLPHQIRDSNSVFLQAALAEQHFRTVISERISDNPGLLTAALERLAAQSDVVIMTGGMSVGRYDFAAEAIRQAGADIHFHGIAMKPGKPQLFASDSQGRLIFGLPGNPVSAMVGYYEFVLPALYRLAGSAPVCCRRTLTVRTAEALTLKGNRQNYVPAKLAWTDDGPLATAVALHGSADLVAAVHTDGTLIVPPGCNRVPVGTPLAFRPWRDCR